MASRAPSQIGTRHLLRIADVARLTTYSTSALHRQRFENRPPGNLGFRIGHALVWDAAELDQWIDDRRQSERDERAAS